MKRSLTVLDAPPEKRHNHMPGEKKKVTWAVTDPVVAPTYTLCFCPTCGYTAPYEFHAVCTMCQGVTYRA